MISVAYPAWSNEIVLKLFITLINTGKIFIELLCCSTQAQDHLIKARGLLCSGRSMIY